MNNTTMTFDIDGDVYEDKPIDFVVDALTNAEYFFETEYDKAKTKSNGEYTKEVDNLFTSLIHVKVQLDKAEFLAGLKFDSAYHPNENVIKSVLA